MADDLVKRLRSLADCDSRAGEPLGRAMREAAARIEQLEREKREAALDALAAMGQAQEAYEAQLKAEACAEVLEREAILDAKLLADTQALLDTALEVLRECHDALRDHGKLYPHMVKGFTLDAQNRAAVVLAVLEGGKKDD